MARGAADLGLTEIGLMRKPTMRPAERAPLARGNSSASGGGFLLRRQDCFTVQQVPARGPRRSELTCPVPHHPQAMAGMIAASRLETIWLALPANDRCLSPFRSATDLGAFADLRYATRGALSGRHGRPTRIRRRPCFATADHKSGKRTCGKSLPGQDFRNDPSLALTQIGEAISRPCH